MYLCSSTLVFCLLANFTFYLCIISSTFFVAFLEKMADDRLRQYSLEGETYLPGVLGLHVISLLQQREGLWSHGSTIKYGLLGTVKKRESKSILSPFSESHLPVLGHLTKKISVYF